MCHFRRYGSSFFMVFISFSETSNRFQLAVHQNFYYFFGHLIPLSLRPHAIHYLNHSFNTSRSDRWAENTIRQHEGIRHRNILILETIEYRTQFCSQCKFFGFQISQCVDEIVLVTATTSSKRSSRENLRTQMKVVYT